MEARVVLLAVLVATSVTAAVGFVILQGNDATDLNKWNSGEMGDPLIQAEGHDHMDPSEHNFSTDNIELLDFNPLSNPGNAEIQVADSPDGRTYAYQAGWSEVHIIDVTDPTNTTVIGIYEDPNTQVLDVKYLQSQGNEYLILQNQLVDSGYSDPNVGEWGDPTQVSVVLIDVTDKSNPVFVDNWFDYDHPTGPHNLYTYMIDNEWYIFVANPDYDQCYEYTGDACGGVTIAHLNLPGSAGQVVPRPPGLTIGTIEKVGEYEVSWETTRGGWVYIHDMTVQKWPGDDQNDPRYGRTYIYGAYWEAGLRIADVSDVPHPVNSPESYVIAVAACRGGGGTSASCTYRAPEVGLWMDFSDQDGDGNPDSGTTGNENGGRSSYIHYSEPYPEMVDVSHLGLGDELKHLTALAVETLTTNVGTGMVYLLDTTEYEEIHGSVVFKPKLLGDWENPYAADHCYGGPCEGAPNSDEWLLFSPHNLDTAHFETDESSDQSNGGNWDGRIYLSHYHAGLWIIDVESMINPPENMNKTESHMDSTIGYYLPHGGEMGVPLDSAYYDFGWIPFLWAAEYHNGYTYVSCITSGLYVLQLDIDKSYVIDES